MAIICHPLTAVDGTPAYTADNYRHVVNSMLFPSNSTALGSIQGIRVSSNSPVLSITSLQVKVTSHVGVICLSSGTYTYVIDSDTTIQIPDKTNNYKIAVIVNDPSASIGSGSVPEAKLSYFLATVPDSQISGIVLGQINAGVASDTAVRLDCNWIIRVPSKTVLDTVSAVDGQTAVTTSDNVTYVMKNGSWLSTTYSSSADFASGKIYIRCNRRVGMLRVVGCKIPTSNSWAYVERANTIPTQFCPTVEVAVPVTIENNTSVIPRALLVYESGAVRIQNRGGGNLDTTNGTLGTATWPVMGL